MIVFVTILDYIFISVCWSLVGMYFSCTPIAMIPTNPYLLGASRLAVCKKNLQNLMQIGVKPYTIL